MATRQCPLAPTPIRSGGRSFTVHKRNRRLRGLVCAQCAALGVLAPLAFGLPRGTNRSLNNYVSRYTDLRLQSPVTI